MNILLFLLLWSASVKASPERDGFHLNVTVEYSNGSETLTRSYQLEADDPEAELKRQVSAQLNRLEKIDDAAKAIAAGPVTIDPPPVAVDPVPQDPGPAAFMLALQEWNAVKKASDLGLLKFDDPIVTKALADLTKAFKAEYIGLLVK